MIPVDKLHCIGVVVTDLESAMAQYGEIFIHTDLKRGILYFNEKDVEYRAPLLRNLAK